MSGVENIRKQLAEHNIQRLSEFRNGLIAKTEELQGNSDTVDKLKEKIKSLEQSNVDAVAKEVIDDMVVKLKKELDILESPNTLESLKSTQQLVERRITELQVLGC